jgi:lipopolysaccharide/colanic/teichoic acid biosynthesis glycosyltransferase
MNVSTQLLAEASCPVINAACPWCISRRKRIFDFALASLLLLLSAPLQIVICIVMVLSEQGPVIFRQLRTGRNGIPFTIYKYRTMKDEQDDNRSFVTRANDPRITKLGSLLRRTKLDELPQLINILKGEMSIVGPRPRVITQERRISSARPGLTGIASLMLAHEERILQAVPEEAQEKFHADILGPLKRGYDLKYCEIATLSLDVEIIVRTVFKVYLSTIEDRIDPQPICFRTIKR